MDIRPERNNAQFQPLTIVLRNIIKEYPAGGGVLRELCQNANDAGASEIEFVLDLSQHPTQNILHDGLAEFQGVSLLAYNNSVFTDTDFESLSRIGDSAKAKDLNATGKFGRGFNSVYNWTDTPSILSGSSLLILDPHQTWSASPDVGQPGGPVYNFVKYSQEPAMRNQLAAFHSITNDFDSEFHGTIIRLPLRTDSQAVKSKILPPEKLKSTTETDITDSFASFHGKWWRLFYFLKNLNTITLRIGDKIYAKAVSTAHSFSDNHKKSSINEAYKKIFVRQANEQCQINFVMDISLYRSEVEEDDKGGNDQKFKFAISHQLRQGPKDNTLEKWSRSQKLFPWVAIATPLEGYKTFEGQLFSTLPLPIRTQHSVHIHGMFSITPDRNSIHSGGDWTISEDSEAKQGARWNEWLLHECAPNTWIQNLGFIKDLTARSECKFSGWKFWPSGARRESGKLWTGILSDVFSRVAGRNLELFPTVCDTTRKRDDILFALEVPENIALALQHAGVPMVVPPQDRRRELEALRPFTIGIKPLEPASARTSLSKLKDSPIFQGLRHDFRITLLQYILSDENFREIGSCTAPLIPLTDRTYASFGPQVPHEKSIFIAREDDEAALFRKYRKMVDTSRVSPKAAKHLRKHAINGKLQRFTKISIWEKEDAADYCMKYVFNELGSAHDTDIIHDDHLADFINKLWGWINYYCKPVGSIVGSPLNDLFLLPLVGGEYRRLSSTIPILDVSINRGIGSFLRSTATSHLQLYGRRYNLFTGIGFSPSVGDSLRSCGFLKDYEDIIPLMTWLAANREIFVDKLNNSEKFLLLQHLNALSRSGLNSQKRKFMGEALAGLSLFREATPGEISERPWISLSDRHRSYVGLRDVPVELQAPNTTFIDISNPDTEQILTRLELATCPRPTDLFEAFVIPNITHLNDEDLRASHVGYVLQNYHTLSAKSKDDLSNTEFVPVQDPSNKTLLKLPRDTVVPNSLVSSLYFGDEGRVPTEEFYHRYQSRLLDLGTVNIISSEVILDRIVEYGKRGKAGYPLDEIAAKVEQLFTHYNKPPWLSDETLESLAWIPAQELDGNMGLFSIAQCRDRSRELLVKYIMPLVSFPVTPVWAKCFGWDQPLSKNLLLDQLKKAVTAEDNVVIEHLIRSGELAPYVAELSDMEWIPKFGTLEARFKRLSLFKKLGLQNKPSLEQLKELQDQLSQKGTLGSLDQEKAIFIVTEVGKRTSDPKKISNFKAPDRHGCMHPISKLTAGDPGNAQVDLLILHPGVSLDTARRLGISTFQDRYLELLNDPYYEEEFAQRESPAAVIEDTLKRYTINSTFNEYLANAEDSGGASRVCWFLDATDDYPKGSLLSPKLAEVQGPALFCYNDGVFTDNDFRGIINIGVGSKGSSPSKIGKFGKGALTMYHWTSVPSFISGDHYVVFDPEQKHLPEHPHTKKPRAGMKMKIELIREQCPDQLRPFEGILKFDKDSKSFPGTLFRFPLRRSDTLTRPKIDIFKAREYLVDYYREATTSLLFLNDISSISFWDKGSKEPVWSVSSKVTAEYTEPRITNVKITRRPPITPDEKKTYSDKWCIISSPNQEDINIPEELVTIKKKERLEAKYGLAALLSESPTGFRSSHFVGLPLKLANPLGLPVHINADVIIGSNRQTIPLREKEDGSLWNKWIYRNGIAPLYLDLVAYLMQSDPTNYNFWPEYPSKALHQNTESVTRTISAAFWELVASSPSPLYPPMRLPSSSSDTNNPDVPKNLSLKAAVFNFLDPKDSEFMLPLLSRLGIENIVTPSKTIQDGLIAAQTQLLNSITPAYFLNRLRSSPAHYQSTLLEIWAEKKYSIDFLNSVLSFITRGTELSALADRALLPLANLTLGTFLLKGGNESFLVAATEKEREILDISQNLMVHPGLDPAVLQRIISSEALNVSRFTYNEITRLHPILEERDKEYRRDWLIKVWAYLKTYPSYLPPPNLVGLEHMSVYFGKKVGEPDGEDIFICPSDFENFKYPVIVEQSGVTREVSLVLGSLKGLIQLEKSAFPDRKLPEESIKTVTGLHRLLKSIDLLASEKELFIEEYVTRTIPSSSIPALRNLFSPALLSELLKKYPKAKEYLLQLPIWPAMGSQTSIHQPATKALLPPLAKISSLGMTKDDVFIEPSTAKQYSRELEHLGVKKMALDNFLRNHVGISLGQEIAADKRRSYPALLKVLFNESRDSCSRHPIGVDGDGKFCMLDTLYASNEPVFMAAFRDLEATSFLHPEYRNLDVWQNSSLQKDITHDRYLACARSIQRRGTEVEPISQDLMNDAKKVFEFLCWDTQDIRRWNASTWNQLSRIIFVPTMTVSSATNPEHRMSRMQELSGDTKLKTLLECIIPEYASIAWSQCPIFNNQPTPFVLAKIPGRGAPSPGTVLNHLKFLSNNRYNVTKAQIQDYVKDIRAAYIHLSRQLEMYDEEIGTYPEEGEIWFNVEAEDIPHITMEDFQNSWTASKDLCLGLEYDSPPLQRIRSFLIPYQGLLQNFDIKRLRPPVIPVIAPRVNNHSSLVLGGFQRLRSRGRSFDVKLIAQGEIFEAHWSLLSAVSEYWESMSVSGMRETETRTVEFPEIRPKTMALMLEYIYSGELPPMNISADVTEELEDLIDQLYIADLWQLEDLKRLLEMRLCDKHWIRPETVRRILSCAEDVRAETIAQVCMRYIYDNSEIVQREDDKESD